MDHAKRRYHRRIGLCIGRSVDVRSPEVQDPVGWERNIVHIAHPCHQIVGVYGDGRRTKRVPYYATLRRSISPGRFWVCLLLVFHLRLVVGQECASGKQFQIATAPGPCGPNVPAFNIRGTIGISLPIGMTQVPELTPQQFEARYFYASGKYVKWPLDHHHQEGCTLFLHTNMLLPADCPLPPRCGDPHWVQLSRNWIGNEVGLCYGFGRKRLRLKAIDGVTQVVDINGTPQSDWGEIHYLIPKTADACGNQAYIAAWISRSPYYIHIFSVDLLWNTPAITVTGRRIERREITTNPKLCPKIWPQHLRDQAVYYSGPMPVTMPLQVPVAWVRDKEPGYLRCEELNDGDVFLDLHHIVGRSSGNFSLSLKDTTLEHECLHITHISEYSITPSMAKLFTWIVNEVVTLLGELFDYVTAQSLVLIGALNREFRLVEAAILFVFAVIYFDSVPRSAALVGVAMAITGFRRSSG